MDCAYVEKMFGDCKYVYRKYLYIYIQYILYTYITKYEVNIVLLGAARFPVHGILLLG